MSNIKGRFIVVEGMDGAGKTTQIETIANVLRNCNVQFVTTREPGGDEGAEEIRRLLLHGDIPFCTEAEVLLHVAARAQNYRNFIKPNIDRGVWVICDRFWWSTFAYQYFGKGFNKTHISELSAISHDNVNPDLVILFKLSIETALARLEGDKADNYEAMGIDFYRKVYECYDHLADRQHYVHGVESIVPVDAEKTIEEVRQEVIEAVVPLVNAFSDEYWTARGWPRRNPGPNMRASSD